MSYAKFLTTVLVFSTIAPAAFANPYCGPEGKDCVLERGPSRLNIEKLLKELCDDQKDQKKDDLTSQNESAKVVLVAENDLGEKKVRNINCDVLKKLKPMEKLNSDELLIPLDRENFKKLLKDFKKKD